MPRVSRSPQRDRGGGGHGSDTVDQSSQDQSCCRQTRRCGRQMEAPSSSVSSSRHQGDRRSGGRCHVRRHRERRDDLRERTRREAILEEAAGNDKPSTRSRVCRWANIVMGVVIALGLVFVFYVITTIIIDGSSPLDSLFGHKETVDPNLRNLNSSTNGTLVLVDEIQTKSTVEPEVVTLSTNNITSTIFSVSTRPDKELKNSGKNNSEFPIIINSSNVEGRSFSDIPEDENVDDYYYDDHDDNDELKPSSKTPNNKDDNAWDESVMDTSLNHEMILNNNHQMPDRKNSLSAQILENRKGLPHLHRSDGSHSIQHNLERSVDLKYDPFTTYSRSDQPNPRRIYSSRRNFFLTDNSDNSEDDTFNYNINRRRNENRSIPYIHSPRNAYSDIERYKIHSLRNQDDNLEIGGRDYVARYGDREYDSQPRDLRYESRNRDREAIPYQRQTFQRSEFISPSVSKRYKIRSREPYHSGSFYSPDTDPSPWKEFSYGRSLSTPSLTSDTRLRKLTEQEKSQILEMSRLKSHEQLSRSVDSDHPLFKSHSTRTEYKYPSSATSIRDIIDYMNYRDGKYDSKLRKVSDSGKIFQDIRTPSGFVIGDQDHVIGKNIFKSYNKFAVDNQNYNNPIDDDLSVIHHSNKNNFNRDPNTDDMQGSRNPGHNHNNYYKHSNKNADFYSNNNDHRLPLEDAYPSRPRPEQDDHLYSAGTSFPKLNKVYPTVGDPFVGSSSSRSNTNPFSLILDIYPSEDISDPDAELKTHLSLSDEFRNEYEQMLNVGESRFRSSEHDQNKNEIILHVNLYSKPLRPIKPFTPSNRQEDVSLEFPLTGRLSPLDIYRAIVSQKRHSPIASAQTGKSSVAEHMAKQSSVDSGLDMLDADRKSKLFAAIEKGFKGLEPYRPGSSRKTTADSINSPGIKKEHQY